MDDINMEGCKRAAHKLCSMIIRGYEAVMIHGDQSEKALQECRDKIEYYSKGLSEEYANR